MLQLTGAPPAELLHNHPHLKLLYVRKQPGHPIFLVIWAGCTTANQRDIIARPADELADELGPCHIAVFTGGSLLESTCAWLHCRAAAPGKQAEGAAANRVG